MGKFNKHFDAITTILMDAGFPEYRSWIVFCRLGDVPRKVEYSDIRYIGDGCVEIESEPYKVVLPDSAEGEHVTGITYDKAPHVVTEWRGYHQTWDFEDCLFT